MKTTDIRSRDELDPSGTKKAAKKTPSFSVDRQGESSAGAVTEKDKLRAVPATRDGSNNR